MTIASQSAYERLVMLADLQLAAHPQEFTARLGKFPFILFRRRVGAWADFRGVWCTVSFEEQFKFSARWRATEYIIRNNITGKISLVHFVLEPWGAQ